MVQSGSRYKMFAIKKSISSNKLMQFVYYYQKTGTTNIISLDSKC